MGSILEQIFSAKREELRARVEAMPLRSVTEEARRVPGPRPFIQALRERKVAIIAEIKRASPSKGDILPEMDPAAIARAYAHDGAAALSVLTDRHFKGSLADLGAVRAAVDLPVLRKDFVFDPYQVYEARAAGADAVLLIVAMLEAEALSALLALARELKMAALVEVHDRGELDVAERVGADLIGINNRDLHSFVTDLAVTERLLADYRGGALVVAESGIESADDIRRLYASGARAFLVGESLLRGGFSAQRLAVLAAALEGSA